MHAFEAAFEANLRALGTHTINSTPSHPQTCGKIERFWQTLKKWLRARPAPVDVEELNALLDQFRDFYNHHRPHRALRGATPAEAFAATERARPADRPLPAPVFVTRHTVGDCDGPDTNAKASATAITSPSSAALPSSGNSPPTLAATTSSATRPREPTAHANPNPHHECQRCPET